MLQLFGHVADVGTLVAVGREGHADAMLIQIAQPGRQAEDVHLPASIIDVILAGHIPAGKSEQAGQRSPIGGTAAMTNVQRTGRVGRDEFDLHLLLTTEASSGRSRRLRPARP
jgi:hypothetical protein